MRCIGGLGGGEREFQRIRYRGLAAWDGGPLLAEGGLGVWGKRVIGEMRARSSRRADFFEVKD